MKRHRRWGRVVMMMVLGACMAGTVAAQGATYTDPQGRYSFAIPAGWQPTGPTAGVSVPAGMAVGGIFAAPAPANGHFDVVAAPIPAGADPMQVDNDARSAGLAQFIDQSRGPVRVQQAPGGVRAVTVGGQSGDSQEFLFSPSQSGRLHAAQITTVRGNVEYVLTWVAAENDFDAFLQQGTTVLTSFAFTGGGAATPAAGSVPAPAPGTAAVTLPATGHAAVGSPPGAAIPVGVGMSIAVVGIALLMRERRASLRRSR